MIIGEEKPFTGGVVFKSILTFVVNYVILLAITFFIVFLKNPSGYSAYLAEHLPVLFFAVGCLFLLFWIIYLYYFFDNKSFLAEGKNIWLLFVILDVCVVVCFIVGAYIGVYARPVALLAFLVLFLIGYRDAIFLNIVFAVIMFILDVFTNYELYL